ncbi:MAG TPA: hypothetical protein DCS97_03330 [Planctomycetes bacterium]|nr:hypothetical protein [Planctomycetota bacterium]
MTIRLAILVLLVTILSGGEQQELGDRLSSTDKTVAMPALFELARRGPPSSNREIEIVRMRLADPEPNIRVAAASAAASLHDDGAVPQLINAMRESSGQGSDAFRAALATIAGGDRGGDSPEAWSAWHDNIITSTMGSCSKVRIAVLDKNFDAARSALHPLLMQRSGRDKIVDLLEELGNGDDPRLVALAREGLAAIDTAYARVALANINRTLPEGVLSAADAAAAVVDQVGGQPSRPGAIRRGAPPPEERSFFSKMFSVGFIMIGAAALLYGGWVAGRNWLLLKEKAKEGTQRFRRGTQRFTRSMTSTIKRKK